MMLGLIKNGATIIFENPLNPGLIQLDERHASLWSHLVHVQEQLE